jgi:Rps23 Pro-64 3,4-dihydroxylase Tpa1-like proline 4-hydroxylase
MVIHSNAQAVEAITRRIGDLDSAALFAASGQLAGDSDDVDLLDLQTKLSDSCNHVTQHLSAFVQSTDSQLEMGI